MALGGPSGEGNDNAAAGSRAFRPLTPVIEPPGAVRLDTGSQGRDALGEACKERLRPPIATLL
jgi:hypothetical protein